MPRPKEKFLKILLKLTEHITLLCTILPIYLMSQASFALNSYSTNELDKLEKEFVKLINQSQQVVRHPLAVEYINHIGKVLADTAHLPQPSYFIVKSNEINAFAGPGGHIGINTELILQTQSESELAAVMSHELAHVRLHHLYRMLEHNNSMKIPMLASVLASVALGVINPVLGTSAMLASYTGLVQDQINFTRSNEKEADRIGIDMLTKAKFNPQGMISFFQKMQAATRYYYTADIPPILRTHPLDEERIAEAQNRITKESTINFKESNDYPYFKELIRAQVMKNPKRIIDYYKYECAKKGNNDACAYGLALAYTKTNQANEALKILYNLGETKPENIFLRAAIADAEIQQKKYKSATKKLEEFYKNYPESYSLSLLYADSLSKNRENHKAASVLLKASRLYPNDIYLCQQLSQAQADANLVDLAYFTKAECEVLQGYNKKALAFLKHAKNISKPKSIMRERIVAKIQEVEDN